MNETENQLEALQDIRNMMERSSKFVSLNGFSGVFVGLFALIGVGILTAYTQVHNEDLNTNVPYFALLIKDNHLYLPVLTFYFIIAASVLLCSFLISMWLTIQKARKEKVSLYDKTAKRLLINMMIPLVAGGLFCLVLLYHLQVQLIAPTMLIFYGMALLNSSNYTYRDVRYLGIIEIAVGLIASFFVEEGLICWAFGFGLMHIVYGIMMYFKYESNVLK
ncbi:MAG: hypothetical protein RL708_1033 [Bacteroidota bacterium]|jgi:hypothetical protein